MPKISIIVPVYNVEKFLPKCLDSILTQTFRDWECLVIDDGSTDSSGAICDEYATRDHRFKAFHKENGGVSSARNLGLDNASGEWVMYVDGDDWIEPDSVEILLNTAEMNNSDLVIGDFKFCDLEKEQIYCSSEWTTDKISSLNNYITSVWTCLWAGIAKKDNYLEHSLKSPVKITYCEDFYLMIRLCWFANKIVNCHYAFYNYRQQNGSIMHNLSRKTEADEQWAYTDTIFFFKNQGVYTSLKKTLNWRLLKSTQELILHPDEHSKFISICRDVSNEEILTCPFINKKLKVMAFLLNNNARPIVVLFNKMRNLF